VAWEPPGKDCGACGVRSCRDFAEGLRAGTRVFADCPHRARRLDLDETALLQVYDGVDLLGSEYDFILRPLPGQPSAQRYVHPFHPELVEQWGIGPGAVVIGWPVLRLVRQRHLLHQVRVGDARPERPLSHRHTASITVGPPWQESTGAANRTYQGAVRVDYALEGSETRVAFNAYAFCNLSNNGATMIAWTNRLQGGNVTGTNHGYSDSRVVKLAAEPAVVMVPGGVALPTDTDGDGLYDDVNGNGRPEFADIVLFFNQMTWIPENEPVVRFDFNGNGRIDFADVTWLFNHL